MTATSPTPESAPQAPNVGTASSDWLAVFHIQNPLTGEATPVVRPVNDRTTIAELADWHRRNCLQPKLWKESWLDVRILPFFH